MPEPPSLPDSETPASPAADPSDAAGTPTLLSRMRAGADALIRATTRGGRWLVLPVSLLLFVQWPLREVVQAYSREANDLAQVLFAIYAGIAITYATRRDAHLAVEAFASRRTAAVRSCIARAAAVLVLVPWSAFLLYAAWPLLANSVRQWEAFPETFNPGYWALKLAVGLMAVLVLLQALVTVLGRRQMPDD
jgi:TRAP-type mannitol/chloroaromatic compound transport system permease small subunit